MYSLFIYFNYNLKYIEIIEISVAETPDILEACPIDLGLICFNFILASVDRELRVS